MTVRELIAQLNMAATLMKKITGLYTSGGNHLSLRRRIAKRKKAAAAPPLIFDLRRRVSCPNCRYRFPVDPE